MSIICPNMKNPEVAREFNELVLAIGENGAYQVWSLNNGNGIDKAPNGEPSILFLHMLTVCGGNREEAVKMKAKCFGNKFLKEHGDWTSLNSEPLVKYYGPTMGKTIASKSNSRLIDFDDISREPIRQLAERLGKTVKEVKKEGGKEYKDLILSLIDEWKSKPENKGKILVVSNKILSTEDIFDNTPSIPSKDEFVKRQIERGESDKTEAELYYDDLLKHNPDLLINDRFVSDIEKPSYDKQLDKNGEPKVEDVDTTVSNILDKTQSRSKTIADLSKIYQSDEAVLSNVQDILNAFDLILQRENTPDKVYKTKKEAQDRLDEIKKQQYGFVIENAQVISNEKGRYRLEITTKDNISIAKHIIERFLNNQSDEWLNSELLRLEILAFNNSEYYINPKKKDIIRQLIINKNDEYTEEEIDEALLFLDELSNNQENNAYVECCIRWLKNQTIRLPRDNEKVRQLFDKARIKHIDVQGLKNPYELLLKLIENSNNDFPSVDITTFRHFHFNHQETINGNVIDIYDVDDSEEGQLDLINIIVGVSPRDEMGKPVLTSPWCLGTYNYHQDGTATATESAKRHWKHYNKRGRKIAICNGKPISFMSSKNDYDEWWDFYDSSHRSLDKVDPDAILYEASNIRSYRLNVLLQFGNFIIDRNYNSDWFLIQYRFRQLNLTISDRLSFNSYGDLNVEIGNSTAFIDCNSSIRFTLFKNIFCFENDRKNSAIKLHIYDKCLRYILNNFDIDYIISHGSNYAFIVKWESDIIRATFGKYVIKYPNKLNKWDNDKLIQLLTRLKLLKSDIEKYYNKIRQGDIKNVLLGILNTNVRDLLNKINEIKDIHRNIVLLIYKNCVIELKKSKTVYKRNKNNTKGFDWDAYENTVVDNTVNNNVDLAIRDIGYTIGADNVRINEYEIPTDVHEEIQKRVVDNDLANRYKNKILEPIKKELNEKLNKILTKFHFAVLIGPIQKVFGNDVLGAFDALLKIVYLANHKDQNAITNPEEFAHAFIKMMGATYRVQSNRENHPENKEYSELRDLIELTTLYSETEQEYSSVYRYPNGNINYPAIKEEALGKALAVVLTERYEKYKEDRKFLNRLKKWFRSILNWFKKTATVSSEESLPELELRLNDIADSILKGDYYEKYLKKIDDSEYELLDYGETILHSVQADNGKALNIMRGLSRANGIITGSMANRRLGTIYRSQIDSLHDIDCAFSNNEHGLTIQHPELFDNYWNRSHSREEVLQHIIRCLQQNATAQNAFAALQLAGTPHFLYAFGSDGNVIVNMMICEDQSLVDRFMALEGNFNTRLHLFTEEELSLMYMIDLFFNGDDKVSKNMIPSNAGTFGINLAHYTIPFEAKLKFGRAKDLYDYQMWLPASRLFVVNDGHIMYLLGTSTVHDENDDYAMAKIVSTELEKTKYSLLRGLLLREYGLYLSYNNLEDTEENKIYYFKQKLDECIDNAILNSLDFVSKEHVATFKDALGKMLHDPNLFRYALWLLLQSMSGLEYNYGLEIKNIVMLYLKTFRASELVLEALNKLGGNTDRNIQKLADLVITGKIDTGFINGIMMKIKLLFSKNIKVKQLARLIRFAMVTNDESKLDYIDVLGYMKSKHILFSEQTTDPQKILLTIVQFIENQIKAYSSIGDTVRKDRIKLLSVLKELLKALSTEHLDDASKTLILLYNLAFCDLLDASEWIKSNQLDPANIDYDKLNEIRINVLDGYKILFESGINLYIRTSKNNKNIDTALVSNHDLIQSIINNLRGEFDDLQYAALDIEIDKFYDQYCKIGDNKYITNYDKDGNVIGEYNLKDELKRNARLYLRGQIDVDSFSSFLDHSIGYATSSKNMIINMVDAYVRLCDLKTRTIVDEKLSKLARIIKKNYGLLRRLMPGNIYDLFLEKHKGVNTGNMLSAVNVGKYYIERANFTRNFFLQEMPLLHRDLLVLKYSISELLYSQRIDGTWLLSSDDSSTARVLLEFISGKYSQAYYKLINNGLFLQYLQNSEFNYSYSKLNECIATTDSYIRNYFNNAVDEFNRGKKHKRYTADFYIKRRQYLSEDTIEQLEVIDNLILAIRERWYDEEVGAVIFDNSTNADADRRALDNLKEQKRQLGNQYVIEKDNFGKITGIRFKEGDARRMAMEIAAWNSAKGMHIRKHITPESEERFLKIRQAIADKYGTSSPQYLDFVAQNLKKGINIELYDEERERILGRRINKQDSPYMASLRSRRKAILDAVRDTEDPMSLPNLDLLSEEAWRELKRIDVLIEANYISTTDLTPDEIESLLLLAWQLEVPVYGETKSYLERLNEQYEQSGDIMELYDRYYYDKKGDSTPLSAFFYQQYAERFISHNRLSYAYTDFDDNSDWVDEKYDETAEYDNVDADAYRNEDYFNRMQDESFKETYEAFIETMEFGWSLLPQNRIHYKYMLPQQFGGTRSYFVAKKKTANDLLPKLTIDMLDPTEENEKLSEDVYEEFSTKPDGTPKETIPLRHIKSMAMNAGYIDTDLGKTIAEFVKTAVNYRYKSQLVSKLESIEHAVGGGFERRDIIGESSAAKRIGKFLTAYVYDRKKTGWDSSKKLSKMDKFWHKFLDFMSHYAYSGFMTWSKMAVLKNSIDSWFSALVTTITGKYISIRDAAFGLANINSDKVKGLIRINGMHEDAAYTYKGLNNPIGDFIDKFWGLGFLTGADYTAKAYLVGALYHNRRLMLDPTDGRVKFMSRQEARLAYINAKGGVGTKKMGDKAWSKASTTLLDAYGVNEDGSVYIKPEFVDYVCPPTIDNIDEEREIVKRQYEEELSDIKDIFVKNRKLLEKLAKWEFDHRSHVLESLTAATCVERSSVINGVFSPYGKNWVTMHPLGAQAFFMRGWMVSQLLDHIKDGDDFMHFEPNQVRRDKNGNVVSANILNKYHKSMSSDERGDRFEFKGKFNPSTGFLELGDWNYDPIVALIKMAMYMRSYEGRKELTSMKSKLAYIGREIKSGFCDWSDNKMYAFRTMLLSTLFYCMQYALSFPLGWWVENLEKDLMDQDPKKRKELLKKESREHRIKRLFAHTLYAANNGVMSERISQIGIVPFICQVFEFITTPFTAIGSTSQLGDLYEMAVVLTTHMESFSKIVYSDIIGNEDIKIDDLDDVDASDLLLNTTSGVHKDLKKATKLAMKGSHATLFVRRLGLLNIYKGFSIPATETAGNYYWEANIAPGYKPTYTYFKPKKGTTDMYKKLSSDQLALVRQDAAWEKQSKLTKNVLRWIIPDKYITPAVKTKKKGSASLDIENKLDIDKKIQRKLGKLN